MAKIVITGATGNVGRALVRTLVDADEEVIAVSRRRPADESNKVRHVTVDLSDAQSLHRAVSGADALFLLIAGSGDGIDPHEILDVVKRGGVRRVVLLSSQGAGTRPDSASHHQLRLFEDAVRDSGLEWTVLRPGGFATNAFMWAEQVRSQRAIAAPFADVGLPIIDPSDIAEVAAAVLRHDGHHGRTYELTGPSPVTPRDQAGALGDALATPIELIELSRNEARAQLLQFMPEVIVDGTLSILGDPLPSEQSVSPDVEKLLGRTPRTFADWARRNAEAFR